MRINALAIAAIVAAVLIAWLGGRPSGHHWESVNPEPQDGTNAFELQRGEGAWDAMVAGRLPELSHSVADVAGRDATGQVLIARSDYVESSRGLRTFHTAVQAANGDTLAWLDERALICAVPAYGETHDLLVWSPEVWLSRSGGEMPHPDPERVFSDVIRKDMRFRSTAAFQQALAMASAVNRFGAACRLAVVTSDGLEKRSFDFDPMFTPGAGGLYDTPGGRVVLIETDTAHANSDLLYLLFEQPSLRDGDALTVADSDDIGGSLRGLAAAAPDTGDVLWYSRLGVMCLKRHVVDLDRDGVDEILLESYGIENDVDGGGTTDSGTAYLMCLDQGGNILWRMRVLGEYCGVQAAAADLGGDGNLEVVATWSSGRHSELGGVIVLDSAGRRIKKRTDLGGLYGLVVADFDGDGDREIATGAPGGVVLLMNDSLDIETERMMPVALLERVDAHGRDLPGSDYAGSGVPWRRRAIPVAAADVSGGAEPELLVLESLWSRWDLPGVVRSGRGDLVVLDGSLDELMRAPIDVREDEGGPRYPSDIPASMKMSAFPLDHDGDGTDEIALWPRPAHTFSYWGLHER